MTGVGSWVPARPSLVLPLCFGTLGVASGLAAVTVWLESGRANVVVRDVVVGPQDAPLARLGKLGATRSNAEDGYGLVLFSEDVPNQAVITLSRQTAARSSLLALEDPGGSASVMIEASGDGFARLRLAMGGQADSAPSPAASALEFVVDSSVESGDSPNALIVRQDGAVHRLALDGPGFSRLEALASGPEPAVSHGSAPGANAIPRP